MAGTCIPNLAWDGHRSASIPSGLVQFPPTFSWLEAVVRHFGANFLSFAAFLGAIVVYAQNVNIKQPSDITEQKQITSDERGIVRPTFSSKRMKRNSVRSARPFPQTWTT